MKGYIYAFSSYDEEEKNKKLRIGTTTSKNFQQNHNLEELQYIQHLRPLPQVYEMGRNQV